MLTNLFIIGLDDYNLERLERLGLPDIRYYPLLTRDDLRSSLDFDIPELMDRCRRTLNEFDSRVDGVCSVLDFPATIMASLLASERGLPHTPIDAVLKCEHKYWSRLEQRNSIPEMTPAFDDLDPFETLNTKELDVDYPFWVKPVKSFRSFLAFRIAEAQDLEACLPEIRAKIRAIAAPFATLLEYAEIPEHLVERARRICLVEEESIGRQVTVEGWTWRDGGEIEVQCYGVVESIRDHRASFTRFQYPAQIDDVTFASMEEAATRFLRHIGYSHGPFNMEFFIPEEGPMHILEVNPRNSQSHAYIFERVHGISHHKVMVDCALGRRPEYPGREGQWSIAAKCLLRTTRKGFMTHVPMPWEIERAQKLVPEALIRVHAEEGRSLSSLQLQDSYSFELAEVHVPANSEDELLKQRDALAAALPFRMAAEFDLEL